MYTKRIKYQRFSRLLQEWVDASFPTTDDAIWLHLTALETDKGIRSVVVEVIENV